MSYNEITQNNSLGLHEKCKLLDQYKNEKKTMIELTKIWKICQSTVYNIISKDKSIRLEATKRGNSHRNRVKAPKFCAIEKQLFGEFTEARLPRPNLPIYGSWLKIRAKRIAADKKIVDFK